MNTCTKRNACPIVCNGCGGVCSTPSQEEHVVSFDGPHGDGTRDWYGLIRAEFTTGYFSDALPDMKRYRFSLCEPCVKALMETFVIPAQQEEYGFDEGF